MSILAALLIAPILVYRRLVSPLLPPSCRFVPTCSAYAVESIRVHGARRGSWLAGRRVLRCHPGREGGWDPVPPRAGREKGKPDGPQDAARVSTPHPGPGSLPGSCSQSPGTRALPAGVCGHAVRRRIGSATT